MQEMRKERVYRGTLHRKGKKENEMMEWRKDRRETRENEREEKERV